MEVTFTRTAQRRYSVSVARRDVALWSYMETAPGYDARLPHDMAHFIVENELGIKGGVFGQLFAGGTAGSFIPTDIKKRRRIARRGHRIARANKKDAQLSERLVWFTSQVWQRKTEVSSYEEFGIEDIKRVCREFDAASGVWSKLAVGESMTLVWRGRAHPARPRSRR